jgi:hypothetical protein
LCARDRDELQVVSNVVQKDLRSFRHMKDQ